MREIHPLWAYTIIFLVSLFGAYIAFGILESTGIVKDERIQLSGAGAGFLVIFSAFSMRYSSEMKKIRDFQEKILKEYQEKISQGDILFSLVFPGEDALSVNFNNKKNGTYEIIYKDQPIMGDDLKLMFNSPSGYIWKPPVKIAADSTVVLDLVEDGGKKWIVKELLRTIPLYPRQISK